MARINPKEITVERKDMSEECGIDPTMCNGGVQCYEDNGITKHCNKCCCRVCVRGQCVPSSLKVR